MVCLLRLNNALTMSLLFAGSKAAQNAANRGQFTSLSTHADSEDDLLHHSGGSESGNEPVGHASSSRGAQYATSSQGSFGGFRDDKGAYTTHLI